MKKKNTFVEHTENNKSFVITDSYRQEQFQQFYEECKNSLVGHIDLALKQMNSIKDTSASCMEKADALINLQQSIIKNIPEYQNLSRDVMIKQTAYDSVVLAYGNEKDKEVVNAFLALNLAETRFRNFSDNFYLERHQMDTLYGEYKAAHKYTKNLQHYIDDYQATSTKSLDSIFQLKDAVKYFPEVKLNHIPSSEKRSKPHTSTVPEKSISIRGGFYGVGAGIKHSFQNITKKPTTSTNTTVTTNTNDIL